jgi:rubrerythrin
MTQFRTAEEILNYAIEREEEAAQFYTNLARTANRPEMKQTFEDFAREEMAHKAKLMAVRDGKYLLHAEKKVPDLKIAEYKPQVVPGPNMTYAEALIVAMQREKASFKLYSDLALITRDENVRKTFEALALEEARHKLRFELEYDREYLQEN